MLDDIVRGYAVAVAESARAAGHLEQLHGELETMHRAILSSDTLRMAISDPSIPTLERRAIVADLGAALRGRLAHADPREYNAVQRAAYLFAIADAVLLVLSGLVLWKSVQFPFLRTLVGGYEGARLVHFAAMSGLVFFVAVHLVMVMLVPRSLLIMVRGR